MSDTKNLILKSAYLTARKSGLMGLTIGHLAKAVGMSKSGLFGHFNSKEKLQLMVLEYSANQFTSSVILPAIKKERGLARLDHMMECWLNWSGNSQGGCPVLSAIIEFDDHPGLIKNKAIDLQTSMLNTFSRAIEIAIEENEIDKKCNLNQFTFQLYGLMTSYHVYNRLLGNKEAKKLFKQSYSDLKNHYQSTQGRNDGN